MQVPKGYVLSDFDMMGLPAKLVARLTQMGITDPTPIQKQAIPHALNGRDVMGLAQTGTGKTAAFGVPIVTQMLDYGKKPDRMTVRGLILAPTRELAGQIAVHLRGLCEDTPLKVGVVVGGQSINAQIKRLERGTDLLVATPGRLIDLVEQRALTLKDVEILVLDEADQMLDLGFIHALKRIVPMLPKDRQTLFFSATMPKAIAELAGQFLANPEKVSVAPESTTAERVKQTAMHVGQPQKQSLLKHVLMADGVERALVFVRTKHGADRVVRKLMGQGVHALAIHGNKSQPQRQKALEAFKSGECRVMIATEVAARGIDIDGLSHVINYDVPNVPEQYVHRIGRTGRAGAEGQAISFVAREEIGFMKDIERLIRMKVDVVPTPEGLTTGDEPDVKPQFEKRTQDDPRSRGGRKDRGERGEGRGERRGEGRGRPAGRRDDRRDGKPKRREDARTHAEKPVRTADASVVETLAREQQRMSQGETRPRPPRRDDRPQRAKHEGGRGAGRPEGRSEGGRREGRPEGGWREGRPEGGRREGRPEGGRREGRPEGRSEGRSDQRSEGRADRRPYGKSEGGGNGKRFGKPGGKPQDRGQNRFRRDGDGASQGKPSGGSQGKSYGKPGGKPGGKPQGKPAGKREGWSPDKPTNGRKHRSGAGKSGGGGNRGGSQGRSRSRGRTMEPA